MKLIFSRKGFDSSIGKVPSPILPDRRMIFLPIPARNANSNIRYRELTMDEFNLGDMVHTLTKGRIAHGDRVHLDPDLNPAYLERKPGWRPLFGQAGAAQGHLLNQNVGPGDIFLFFGWFQKTQFAHDRLIYNRESQGVHAIFGWLQIEETISASRYGRAPQWAAYHPHFQRAKPYPNDTVYVSTKLLTLPHTGKTSLPGAGIFRRFSNKLQLTKPRHSRSIWQLPGWCYPRNGRMPLTYHPNPSRWQRQNGQVTLQTAGRGQEFVMDTIHYPEALHWLQDLLRAAF
jgi:hypothetical protein